jgi:hypothetical protein
MKPRGCPRCDASRVPSTRPPPIFPMLPLQLEVGPQNQSGVRVPRALKMQHRGSDPPLKAGELDFHMPRLPTS